MNSKIECHLVPRCRAVVDFFREGKRVLKNQTQRYDYFLTHFHGDHYGNLSRDFPFEVFCTQITANLTITMLELERSKVVVLKMYEKRKMPQGYSVTPLDANHCPGACLLLFETTDGKKHLHTGDMRFHTRFKICRMFSTLVNSLETLFLDTTYANPKHDFPLQVDSIKEVVDKIKSFRKERTGSKVLVLLAAYNIGKEKIMLGVAEALNAKLYITDRKAKILNCLENHKLQNYVTTDVTKCNDIHVCKTHVIGQIWPYWQPGFKNLQDYREKLQREHGLSYDYVLGILPTGWAEGSNFNKRSKERVNNIGDLHTFLVPYSEHSNYKELYDCVQFLKPTTLVPTVFSNEKESERIIKRFKNLLNRKRNFINLFAKGPGDTTVQSVDKKQRLAQTPANTLKRDTSSNVQTATTIEAQSDVSPIAEEIDVTSGEREEPISTQVSIKWTCKACTFINSSSLNLCDICQTPKTSEDSKTVTDNKTQNSRQATLLKFFSPKA